MPPTPTGQIVEHTAKDGQVWRSLRFRANGKRRTEPLGPVSLEEAERKLHHVMADVQRGIWQPPKPDLPAVETPMPTFHEYSSTWWSMTEGQWSKNTKADYRWRLEVHLVPYFETTPMDQITGAAVKRYVADKLAEGQRIRDAAERGKPIMQTYVDKHGRELQRPLRALSARSINMHVMLLAGILDSAIDDDELGPRIPRNAARGRRIKERAPARTYLDDARQIGTLLEAAGELDREATKDRRHVQRHAMIATLTFAGLRIGELLALRWKDVDLAGDWLTVNGTKTDDAVRKVKIRPALHTALAAAVSPSSIEPDAFVFATRTGAQLGPDNFRNRVLAGAVKRANEKLAEAGRAPLPKLTPHSLRRTFCSLLYALGEAPPVVMAEMGHTDPGLALRVYAQAMRRDEHQVAQLRALIEGTQDGRLGERLGERDADTASGADVASPRSTRLQDNGRVAQWESARFTRERSQVRNPPRPSPLYRSRRHLAAPCSSQRSNSETRPGGHAPSHGMLPSLSRPAIAWPCATTSS